MSEAILLDNSDFSGESLFVQFHDNAATKVAMVERASPNGGRFYVTVAALVAAELPANTAEGHSCEVRAGDINAPASTDETAGNISGFRWDGSQVAAPLDFSSVVPLDSPAGSWGEAMVATRGASVGKIVLDKDTMRETTYAPDGVTPIAVLQIEPNLTTPLERSPV